MYFQSSPNATNTFDAIVVGTGIAGGWAAKELTKYGRHTLVLERGREIKHGDYPTANLERWELPHDDRIPAAEIAAHHFKLQRKDYITRQHCKDLFVKDDEYPYSEKRRFDWFRGYHTGGRSIMWGRHSYRMGDLDFAANLRDGIAVDWPIRYADLAPWYDYVETFAGISGQAEGAEQLPDGQFIAPIPMNCVEEDFRRSIATTYSGRLVTPARIANLTEYDPAKHGGSRSACQYRNRCRRGCPFGAYFSSVSATLPVAAATGQMDLRHHMAVKRLVYDDKEGRATGLVVRNTQSGQDEVFYSRGPIFLCASTLHSTAILMATGQESGLENFANTSGQLGRNLMDHHHRLGARAFFDGHSDRYYKGRNPGGGIYIPRFTNLSSEDRRRNGFIRGFGFQGGASRSNWMRGVQELNSSLGPDFKLALAQPGPWSLGITAFGEGLPDPNNRIALNYELLDKDGLPTLTIDAAFGENERQMRKAMKVAAAEMLEAAGGREVTPYETEAHPGHSIHEMGTARMGRDARSSVLNAHNQVWDCPNVYVTDGAAMTSAGCTNPSLTYMALTARAVAHAFAG